eukprot:1997377-Pleurochrysis_carterae.AAC.2
MEKKERSFTRPSSCQLTCTSTVASEAQALTAHTEIPLKTDTPEAYTLTKGLEFYSRQASRHEKGFLSPWPPSISTLETAKVANSPQTPHTTSSIS